MTDRSHWPVLKKSLHDPTGDDGYVPGTPEQRWAMMRQLALNAWAFYDPDGLRRSQLPSSRQVERVIRRKKNKDVDADAGPSV
jgi:hypothetical protein